MTESRSIPKGELMKKCSKPDPEHDKTFSPLLEKPTVVTYVTTPPDGGWGWVVVTAAFTCSFFSDGIINTTGLFIGRIDKELPGSKASVAFMGSILAGFSLVIGPVVSAMVNKYGFRRVAVVGGMLAVVGFAASSFATSIEMLWFTYGIFAGFGLGMMYVPAIIIINFYFERWRSLATSIVFVGGGVGTVLLPPVFYHFLDNYGWRNTMLVQAVMIFICSTLTLTFRLPPPVQVTVPSEEDEESSEETYKEENANNETYNNLSLLVKVKREIQEVDCKHSFDSQISLTSPTPVELNKFFKAGHNTKYATVHDVLSETRCNVRTVFNFSNDSSKKTSLEEQDVKKSSRFDVKTLTDKKSYDQKVSNSNNNSNISENSHPDSPIVTNAEKFLKSQNQHRRNSIKQIQHSSSIFEQHRNSLSLKNSSARRVSEIIPQRLRNRRATISIGARAMYRDDIFLQGNLDRLPEYASKNSGLEYLMAVTRLPTFTEVQEEESHKCSLCPEPVRRTLATMLDLSLLTSPSFLLLCMSGFITNLAFYVPYMFMESRVKEAGLAPELGTYLISIIGITNTFGRVVCGVVTSFPSISALLVNNVFLSVSGVATMLSGLYMTTTYQLCYASVFGFFVSAFSALRSIITVDLIGLEKLTNGFGLMILFQGVSAMVGAPIAGFMLEELQSYDFTFVLTGSVILLSAVMCYPLAHLNSWEKERNMKRAALKALREEVA